MRWSRRSHSTTGLICAILSIPFAVGAPGADAQVLDLDTTRLEASYNTGKTIVRDPGLDAYLAGIVARLIAANADAGAIPIRIHALREPLPYAFGLDNGAVYISTGLLARLRNDSQLAGLIAAEISSTIRHDSQNGDESSRQRAARRAIPNIFLVAVTAGLAAIPLSKGDAEARRTIEEQLQLDSDRVALQWLRAADYQTGEVPRGLQRLLDALTAEKRFGLTVLASPSGLAGRMASFKQAMPPEATAAAAEPAAAAEALAPFARRFTLEIVRDDMHGAQTASGVALLDRLDSEEGATGETACLRAEIKRLSMTDLARLPEVITTYEACTAFADAPADAIRELGFLYRRQGDKAAARLNFARYLERAPGAADAPIVRAYLEEP